MAMDRKGMRTFLAAQRGQNRGRIAFYAAQWMPDMATEARREGWDLVAPDKVGDPYILQPLSSDVLPAALEQFVHRRAAEGSEMHRIASCMLGWA